MFRKLRDRIFGIKNSLTRVDDGQPLGKAALIIVLFLDIFVLFSIFYGLDAHTRQLASPRELVPDMCRQIVLEDAWNRTNRMESLAREINARTGTYYYRNQRTTPLHPVCKPVISPFERMEQDKDLDKQVRTWQKLQREADDARWEVNRLKGAYDTALLDKEAGPPGEKPDVTEMGKKLRAATDSLNSLEKRISKAEATINANKDVQALWSAIGSISDQDRTSLRGQLRELNFWFPLKRLLMEMVFLLPLFFLFYLWYARSVRRGRGLQSLMSAHLLVVASIPILIEVITAVYDIIPKNILKKLFDLLVALKLVALWHYMLIGLAVVFAMVLVYIFQKKLFNRTWLMEKRISKGMCQHCGKKLPGDVRACPYCGFVQFRTCPSCQGQTYVSSRHCRQCGAEMSEE